MLNRIVFICSIVLAINSWGAEDPVDKSAAPIAVHKEFYDYLVAGSYAEAYELLSKPTKQALTRFAGVMSRVDALVKNMSEDNTERENAQRMLDLFSCSDGASLFTRLMSIQLADRDGDIPPYQVPSEVMVAGNTASGKMREGNSITLFKEGKDWKVDLNSGALNTRCKQLEDLVKRLEKESK